MKTNRFPYLTPQELSFSDYPDNARKIGWLESHIEKLNEENTRLREMGKQQQEGFKSELKQLRRDKQQLQEQNIRLQKESDAEIKQLTTAHKSLVVVNKTLRKRIAELEATNPMTQTYDPAAAQANNAARNQEIERAAMPTTKPLTELADNPDHCRQVWECVTGTAHIGSEEPLWISAHEENNFFGRDREYVIIQQEFDRITIWSTGNFDLRLDESETSFNPFALVALLTQLGYAPTEA